MIEGCPRPNRIRVKIHEAHYPPDYVQAYLADEMDEYLDMLRDSESDTEGLLIEIAELERLLGNAREIIANFKAAISVFL
jgi:hypothetical protein